jgi:hypothetical protein
MRLFDRFSFSRHSNVVALRGTASRNRAFLVPFPAVDEQMFLTTFGGLLAMLEEQVVDSLLRAGGL